MLRVPRFFLFGPKRTRGLAKIITGHNVPFSLHALVDRTLSGYHLLPAFFVEAGRLRGPMEWVIGRAFQQWKGAGFESRQAKVCSSAKNIQSALCPRGLDDVVIF